ncbi:MAG: response regulator transcription factor [Fimbriimonadales bacterium]|nr:response regulator transcription factor [Fimbriimonadales bacterium]MDW8051026.1 response regulator transcription factor [Armatimonadota bacterium]
MGAHTVAPQKEVPSGETTRVLLVEDDPVLCETLQYNLQRERLHVLVAHTAEEALRLFHQHKPHLVILDVMLPGRSGFDLCRLIRQHSQTPVLFLTARAAEEDKIRGFELGADDYIVKPFSVAELIARIRSILRRVQPPPPARIHFGDIEIDLEARRVYKGGVEVPMTPKEYALLTLLATHPGKVFTRDQLLDHIWGLGTYVSPRTVDVHIRWLRMKIEPDPHRPRYIQTVRGSGYRLEK